MNEFVFTSMRRVFIRFLEEIEDSKKAFRNYLTFRRKGNQKGIDETSPSLTSTNNSWETPCFYQCPDKIEIVAK